MPYGGPGKSVMTAVMNIYDTAFQRFQYGYGCSITFGLFIIILFLSLTSYKFMNRGSDI